MVKTINIAVDDKDFEKISKAKGKKSWREVITDIKYYEPRAPMLIFGNGAEAKILKREGKESEEFLLEPTKALMAMHNIKDEDLINGIVLIFKCPDPSFNLIDLNRDPAFGAILCLLDCKGKPTSLSKRINGFVMNGRKEGKGIVFKNGNLEDEKDS